MPTLHLHLVLEAFNLPLEYTGETKRILTVQARGSEADSPLVRVSIAWDGQWIAGEAEMRQHLVVGVLS